MKIVYISSSTIPSRAANSIHVMKMCQAFANNGYDVVLLAPDKQVDIELGVEDVFDYYGVERKFTVEKITWPSIRGKGYIYGCFAACRAVKQNPDIVFCRNLIGGYFAALSGKQVIFESHSPVMDSGKISEWFFKKLIKRKEFRKLVVITHSLMTYYEEKYPSLKGFIQVAPDGADPVNENINPVALPNSGTRLQVGYVGHLYQGRGVDILVDMAKKCLWADIHFVGGTQEDINLWKKKSDNLSNCFFHGYMSPRESEKFRISFDVLVSPYQKSVSVAGSGSVDTANWMSPLKVFEYMAAKKPIICSDLPVLGEILTHNYNALMCAPDNVDEWVQALDKLRLDDALAKQLANQAHQDFIVNYTWQARAESLLGNNNNSVNYFQ